MPRLHHRYRAVSLLSLLWLLIAGSAHAQDAIAPEELSQKISAAVKKAQDKGKREMLRGLEFRVRTDGILSIAPQEAFSLEASDGVIVVKIVDPDALFAVEPDTGIVRARRVDVFIQQSTSGQADILQLNPQSPCVSVLQIFQVGQTRPLNISALEKSEQYEIMWTYPEDKVVLEEVADENAIVRRIQDGPAVVTMTLVDNKSKGRQSVEFPIRDCKEPKPATPQPKPVVVLPEPEPESQLRFAAALGVGAEARLTVGIARTDFRFSSSLAVFVSQPFLSLAFDTQELKPMSAGLIIGTGVTMGKITLNAQMPVGLVWETDSAVLRLGAEAGLAYQLRENWAVQALGGVSVYNTSDDVPITGLLNIVGSFAL